MIYPYECREPGCGYTHDLLLSHAEADTDPTKSLYDRGLMACPRCGARLYRDWKSTRISAYHHEIVTADGSTRDFTSEAEYSRYLKDESKRRSDYTGLVHDFVTVDLNDPSVAPPSDEGARATHDAAVAVGRVESKGKFVH